MNPGQNAAGQNASGQNASQNCIGGQNACEFRGRVGKMLVSENFFN